MLLTLRKAVRLLEWTLHSISMIAAEVGFLSASYFSRQFHQRFGVSPRDYRLMLKAREPKRSKKSQIAPQWSNLAFTAGRRH